jgi:uncharacterized integral membrane protein
MRWVWLTLIVLVGLVATAFTIQNSAFEAPLQLNLWVAAWKLRAPVGVPLLMWSSFGAGMVLAGTIVGLRSVTLGRRIKQLEHELAMGANRGKDPWAG